MGENLNIFAIYTSEDIAIMHEITQRLEASDENMKLSIWNDDPIKSGQFWKPQMESSFRQADIFLFFISNTFMHSEFIKQLEFKMVIDRYKAGNCKVLPILIDDCPWGIDFEADEYTFSFKQLEVLPENLKPLKDWDIRQNAYEAILKGITSKIPHLSEKKALDEAKTEEQTALHFEEEKSDHQALEQKRLKEKAATIARAVEEKQRLAEEETKRIEAEQRRVDAASKQKTEALRLKQEEHKIKQKERNRLEEQEANRIASENQKTKAKVEDQKQMDSPKKNAYPSRKILRVALIAVLVTLGVLALSKFKSGSREAKSGSKTQIATEETKDTSNEQKSDIEVVKKINSIKELNIGDFHDGGMVFAVDANYENGMIVHLEDAGPMTWENAMKIHEKLGEGWRLPTLDELAILRKTVGQGANNTAEFSGGLYWSATDYDPYQARLLRFRDGNRSYHYNKVAAHRQYRVRAIRSFSQ